jgi:predicted LPLAT superfamily acyltransferase
MSVAPRGSRTSRNGHVTGSGPAHAGEPAADERAAAEKPPVLVRTKGSWGSIPERGSMLGLRFLVAVYRTLGRRACLVMLHGIAVYFTLAARSARRASRIYLDTLWSTPQGRAALGRPPGFGATLHHIHEFSINVFDRLVAWSGNLEEISFEHRGSEVLFDLASSGSGAFLIGAHQGSFDMMRLLASRYEMTVNVLMFTRHATRINAFFEQLDPKSRIRVLEIEPNSLKTAFLIRECILRGEFVGILADRIHPGARDRPVHVPFLGRETAFSMSPFVLAATLGCPVVHTQCIRLDDRTYESSATVLSDLVDPALPRRRKADALLRAYVAEIEKTCWRAPFQWFNFYDFWPAQDGEAQHPRGAADAESAGKALRSS